LRSLGCPPENEGKLELDRFPTEDVEPTFAPTLKKGCGGERYE
jgi:hypothetical protein